MPKEGVILVVDSQQSHADGMIESLQESCRKAMAVYDAGDAISALKRERIDVMIVDINPAGGIDGMEILSRAREIDPDTAVIIITAYASIESCKEAMRHGAYDYLAKPVDTGQLRELAEQAISTVLDKRQMQDQQQVRRSFVFEGIRGNSPAMEGIYKVLRRVAPTNIPVLIEGQSGTGKELMARAIHLNSPRNGRPFVPINCAGLAETLLESELFGHTKGAFTGASADRKGLFEMADTGTLFLDEIGDMPMRMQAKLLRVLEDGVVTPVGGGKPVIVDVRVISATNHDLIRQVEEKSFRQDLYFRIKGVSITLPGLSDRPEDIPILAEYFLEEAIADTGADIRGFTSAAMKYLKAYNWPGNIRQLRNCINTIAVLCDKKMIDVQDLPPEIHRGQRLLTSGSAERPSDLGGMSLTELEKQAIIDTLAQTNNNREKAAKILGIGERTLYRKIKEYNIS